MRTQILPPLLCVGGGEVGVDDGDADAGMEEGGVVDCVAAGEDCAPADVEDVIGCKAWRGV